MYCGARPISRFPREGWTVSRSTLLKRREFSIVFLVHNGGAGAPLTSIHGTLLCFNAPPSNHPPTRPHPHTLDEAPVFGNLVNRFLLCPGPHAHTPFPFYGSSAVSSNDSPEILWGRGLEELVGGYRSNQMPLLLFTCTGRHGA